MTSQTARDIYNEALRKSFEDCATFGESRTKYHERRIGFDEYMAAREVYLASCREFEDAALAFDQALATRRAA